MSLKISHFVNIQKQNRHFYAPMSEILCCLSENLQLPPSSYQYICFNVLSILTLHEFVAFVACVALPGIKAML